MDFAAQPQHPYYYTSNATASILISTLITTNPASGTPYSNSTFDPDSATPGIRVPFTDVKVRLADARLGTEVRPWTLVDVDSKGQALDFDISMVLWVSAGGEGEDEQVKSGLLSIVGVSPDALQTYSATLALSLREV